MTDSSQSVSGVVLVRQRQGVAKLLARRKSRMTLLKHALTITQADEAGHGSRYPRCQTSVPGLWQPLTVTGVRSETAEKKKLVIR